MSLNVLHPIIEVAPQGDYMSLRYKKARGLWMSKPEKRGEVRAFSVKSRSRLMKKISQLNKSVMPIFVTLTYPSVFPKDFEEYKYHVHKFFISLFRKFPSAGVIWKLEFQSRGAAHFHMLIFGVGVSDLLSFVPECWYRIAGQGDEKHLLWHQGLLGNQHCVQEIRSWNGVRSYASKYMGKLDERTENTGRFWGVRGKVPFSHIMSFRVSIRAALEFRRAFVRKSGMELSRFGFWGYGYDPDWLRFIDWVVENFSDDPPVPESPPKWLEMSCERFL